MEERKRPVVKLFSGAVIQLIPKPLFNLFNLRNDRSERSALFFLISHVTRHLSAQSRSV